MFTTIEFQNYYTNQKITIIRLKYEKETDAITLKSLTTLNCGTEFR